MAVIQKDEYSVEEVVVEIPDMGLDDDQINALKKRFEATVVESLGGNDAMERLRIRIRVRIKVSVRVSVSR